MGDVCIVVVVNVIVVGVCRFLPPELFVYGPCVSRQLCFLHSPCFASINFTNPSILLDT